MEQWLHTDKPLPNWIAKPVVKKSSGMPLDEIALAEVLNELSETDLCHDLIGVFDGALDA